MTIVRIILRMIFLNLLKYSVEHLYFLRSCTFRLMLFTKKFGLFKQVSILVLFHPYNVEDWLGEPYFKKERFNTKLEFLQRDLIR